MLITTATETAEQQKSDFLVDGQPYSSRDYIGITVKPGMPGYGTNIADKTGGKAVEPQAFLVMQPPHSVTQPHFHQTNQFQVIVAGGGAIGKVRTDPLTVQYAGANTPYGPINAEAKGISYFTLRQQRDSGAKYLPAQRDLLVRGQQRQEVGVKAHRAARDLPTESGAVQLETLIEPETDLIRFTGSPSSNPSPQPSQYKFPDAIVDEILCAANGRVHGGEMALMDQIRPNSSSAGLIFFSSKSGLK